MFKHSIRIGFLSIIAVGLIVGSQVSAQTSSSTATSTATMTVSGTVPAHLAFCHTFNRQLQLGSRGADVAALDKVLIAEGIKTAMGDDYFGAQTKDLVKKLQTKHSILPALGNVGPRTRAKLNKLYGCTKAVKISSLIPAQGPVGTTVQIIGSGFASTSNTVHFGQGVFANVPSTDNGTKMSFVVPSTLPHPSCVTSNVCPQSLMLISPGTYPVKVTRGGNNGTSNTVQFRVTASPTPSATSTPFITSITPASAQIGAQVMINGSGFTFSDNKILINDYTAATVSLVNGRLMFTIPESVSRCPENPMMGMPCTVALLNPGIHTLSVKNSNGTSNEVKFTIASSTATTTMGQHVTVSFKTNKREYNLGEKIILTLEAKNNTSERKNIILNNGCRYNYSIGSFNSITSQACTQSITEIAIPAFGTLTYTIDHASSTATTTMGQHVTVSFKTNKREYNLG